MTGRSGHGGTTGPANSTTNSQERKEKALLKTFVESLRYYRSTCGIGKKSANGILAIAGGWGHSLTLKGDGTVWAWGYNEAGQLGNGTNSDSNVPAQVLGLTGVTVIVGGYYHSLALKNDGTIWVWGHNRSGQLGNGTNSDSNVPVRVSIPRSRRKLLKWTHTK